MGNGNNPLLLELGALIRALNLDWFRACNFNMVLNCNICHFLKSFKFEKMIFMLWITFSHENHDPCLGTL